MKGLLIVIFAVVSFGSAYGSVIREEGSESISEALDGFKTMAEDTEFTATNSTKEESNNASPDPTKFSDEERPSESVAPKPSEEVASKPSEEVASKPSEEVAPKPSEEVAPKPSEEVALKPPEEIASKPTYDEPSSSTSTTSTTTTTTTTTTTPTPSTSSISAPSNAPMSGSSPLSESSPNPSNTSSGEPGANEPSENTSDKPKSGENDILSGPFAVNSEKDFSEIDTILEEIKKESNATSSVSNGTTTPEAEPSSGGGPSVDGSFVDSNEKLARSTRTRALSGSVGPFTHDQDAYQPPIEVITVPKLRMIEEPITTTMTTVSEVNVTLTTPEARVTEPEAEMLSEIIVDEPRTRESDAYWSRYAKATGHRVVWSSERGNPDNREEERPKDFSERTEIEPSVTEPKVDSICEKRAKVKYFYEEIKDLSELSTRFRGNQTNHKAIEKIRCSAIGLSKILEGHNQWIEDWSDESHLPLKEIDRLERQIADYENAECNCTLPLIGEVINSIYSDPFLHEERSTFYKNRKWSPIIRDLRVSHGKIKHLYGQLKRNQEYIVQLMNISVSLSQDNYQWRAKQTEAIGNSLRHTRRDPYPGYRWG